MLHRIKKNQHSYSLLPFPFLSSTITNITLQRKKKGKNKEQKKGKEKLTPQLEQPQLAQLPLQLEQLAQEQGDIVFVCCLVGLVWCGFFFFFVLAVCVDVWIKKKERLGREGRSGSALYPRYSCPTDKCYPKRTSHAGARDG